MPSTHSSWAWLQIQGEGKGREGGEEGIRVLTTAGCPQRDDTGQRELHKGRYYTGVEPPGLPQQALGCVWEVEAGDVLLRKDLEGVFTSGLMTGREAEQGATDTVRGHTAWRGHLQASEGLPGLDPALSFAPAVSPAWATSPHLLVPVRLSTQLGVHLSRKLS